MQLEVHERMAILQILPTKGDYAAVKELRVAREMIGFTSQEVEFYEIKTVTGADGKGSTQWSSAKAAQMIKDVPITTYVANVLRNTLAEMSKKHELTDQYLSLYEKFVTDYR